MDDFETFARDKIAKLRAEAEALERTLKEYQVAMGRSVRSSGGQEQRAGAFGAVLDALTAAGPKGMSLDDMIGAAELVGFKMNRNTLRSQLFTAKGKGQVEALDSPGHYRIAQAEPPPPPPPAPPKPSPSPSPSPWPRPVQPSQPNSTTPPWAKDDDIPF